MQGTLLASASPAIDDFLTWVNQQLQAIIKWQPPYDFKTNLLSGRLTDKQVASNRLLKEMQDQVRTDVGDVADRAKELKLAVLSEVDLEARLNEMRREIEEARAALLRLV